MSQQRSLILFLVEGPSDRAYLHSIKKLIKDKSKNMLEFKITYGDLLVKKGTNYTNVEIKVGVAIQEYLERSRMTIENIKMVIHVVDLDGAFINPNNVVTDKDLPVGQTVYYRDRIEIFDKNNIIKRNEQKSECLNVLYNLNEINYGNQRKIPYKLYYFSTNIDDYFYDKQNMSDEEKEAKSDLINDTYEDNPEGLRYMLENDNVVKGEYLDTWNYVKEGNNSLSRCTNFNKFFTEVLDKL